MTEQKQLRERFEALYAAWQEAIRDPKIQFSSRPQDYTDNEPYRAIVELGREALPLVLEKLEEGVFFMNQAALELSGLELEAIVEEERAKPAKERVEFFAERIPEFLSEQEKSRLIALYARQE